MPYGKTKNDRIMKTKLKEERNKAICARVFELLGTGMKIMDVYAKVGKEFWIEESTIRRIYNKYGHYN